MMGNRMLGAGGWVLVLLLMSMLVSGAEETKDVAQAKFRVTGLFSKDRVDDLREVLTKLPEIKLVELDFDRAEATFEYDAAKALGTIKPAEIPARLDAALRQASFSTFGILPLSTFPSDKLELVEIPVVGLDCKGCSLAAYETVYKLEGVERARASFREGLVTVWIDPLKTDKSQLEEALKKRNVTLKTP